MSQEMNTGQNEEATSTAFTRGLTSLPQPEPEIKFAHQLFEEQAARTPDRLAIVCGGRKLTYAELDSRASQLARHLRLRGVGPNTLVAIAVERSLEIAVGILGVLKAGGAYVPLNPAQSQEQLRLMVNDSAPLVLLTQSHVVTDLPLCQAQKLFLDAVNYAMPNAHRAGGELQCVAADLACVIYSPRATGGSKGVLISQGNLAYSIRSTQRATLVSRSDVYLHSASISEASSARQLLFPLSVGATVVVASAEEIGDPLKLFKLIKRLHVTVIDLVPSHWQHFIKVLQELQPEVREELLDNKVRLVLSHSEPLPFAVACTWRLDLNQQASWINLYGQPETSGTVATYPVAPSADNSVGMVPLGSAVDDAQIYLLDGQMQPVGAGEVGEICIGGATVCGGYLNAPIVSAYRFPRDPFSKLPGARLYRTSDLGRLRADGTLEWLTSIELATGKTDALNNETPTTHTDHRLTVV